MGLFDQVKGQMTSTLIGQVMSSMGLKDSPIFRAAMELVFKAGGINGLSQRFQDSGLGGIFGSWVNPGSNEVLAPDQVHQIFGAEEIEKSARDNGVSSHELSEQLSTLLPTLVDHLTPDGHMPVEPPSPDNLLSTAFDINQRSTH